MGFGDGGSLIGISTAVCVFFGDDEIDLMVERWKLPGLGETV